MLGVIRYSSLVSLGTTLWDVVHDFDVCSGEKEGEKNENKNCQEFLKRANKGQVRSAGWRKMSIC